MLKLENINVSLNQKHILDSINLQINDDEFISVLGPSGCGKSTLLKTICGFVPHQTGSILNNNVSIDNTPVYQRNIVMVFQDIRLFPNMLVWENVAFPLKMKGISRQERKRQAYDLLGQVNLDGFENRKISQLSGGQQQRVALVRAFAAHPQYLLLDEPFSGLDEELKIEMRQLLCDLQKAHHISVVFVTHDKQEALMISNKIAVMNGGRILQLGTPKKVYEEPESIQVAEYFGDRNFLKGRVLNGNFKSDFLEFAAEEADGEYCACIPCNAITVTSNGLPFKVKEVRYMGQRNKVTVSRGTLKISLMVNSLHHYAENDRIFLDIDQSKILYFRN